MTIITKPLSEKKSEKLAVPLVEEDTKEGPPEDVESQSQTNVRMFIIPARARRVSAAMTLCLLLAALAVVGIGILGGTYFYRQYIREQLQFRGRCAFKYDDTSGNPNVLQQVSPMDIQFEDFGDGYNGNPFNDGDSRKFLQEEFELDLEQEEYEKITVPDFDHGRSGRFIYDFNNNMTSIVDVTGNRCFILPLNRTAVLPPKSFLDLVNKIWGGHYKLNTEIIRETMKVVTPPLDKNEVQNLGKHIYKECKNGPIYKLEKYVSGVVKRSANPENEITYTNFVGTGILMFDIVNLDDVKAYEASQLT